MGISYTVSCSCSRSHLSDNGLPSYVFIIFFLVSPHHSTPPDHWQDVLVGGILGTVLAYFSYRQYYPNLASKDSQRPYSPRIRREDTGILPTHNLRTFREGPDNRNHESLDLGNHNRYNDHDDGLDETVPRPETGHLKSVWREGEDE